MRLDQKRLTTLRGVFNEVEEAQDGCSSTHAATISMLMRMKKLQFFPDAICALDDDRCEELPSNLIEAERTKIVKGGCTFLRNRM